MEGGEIYTSSTERVNTIFNNEFTQRYRLDVFLQQIAQLDSRYFPCGLIGLYIAFIYFYIIFSTKINSKKYRMWFICDLLLEAACIILSSLCLTQKVDRDTTFYCWLVNMLVFNIFNMFFLYIVV